MSASALGELPKLGKEIGRRSARNNSASLNDAIGALLSDENERLSKTNTRNQESSNGNGTSFYNQLITAVDDNIHGVAVEEPEERAASGNIDDLENNLFSSLTLKQKKPAATKSGASVNGVDNRTITKTEKGNSATLIQSETKNSISKPGKHAFGEDDLQDLLGEQDEDDTMPLRRSKPKLTLNSKRSDQKDILIEAVGSVMQVTEQPRTSYGMPKLSDEASVPSSKDASEFVTVADMKGNEETNILDDMGLNGDNATDLEMSPLPTEIINENETKKGSRFDELLGVKSFQRTRRSEHSDMPPDKTLVPLEPISSEEYQFGNYLPSAISKLGSARSVISSNSGTTENEAPLLRPNTAPSGKKSVRFSATVQADNGAPRPFSSPAMGDKSQDIKPNGGLEDASTEYNTSGKSTLPGKDGLAMRESTQDSTLLQSSPNIKVKSMKADDILKTSEQELDKVSQLKHPVFPWQDTVNDSIAKRPKNSLTPSILPEGKLTKQHDHGNPITTTQHRNEVVEPNSYPSQECFSQYVSPHLEPVKEKVDLEKRYKELEEKLKAKEKENEINKAKVVEMEDRLRICEQAKELAMEECRGLKIKICEQDNDNRKSRLELATQVDDLCNKLHRITMERDQLQLSLDKFKTGYKEEMEAFQEGHGVRLHSVEESCQRRIARLQEDIESERSIMNVKIDALMKEKTEQEASFKKKIECLEVQKTIEVSNVKENCRVLMENLKRDHELDVQRCASLHHQEIEAMKSSYSHARALAELTQQVEVSVKEVDQLHSKIDQAHSKGLDQREQLIRLQQEHFKEVEERLTKQQFNNDLERDKLQMLIAKLEAHILQQSRQIEQERWQVQQAAGKLKAQEVAFEEERSSGLKRFAEAQEELQKAKETFLAEQTSILSQCYEEKRRLAAEKAEFVSNQRKAIEKEQRNAERHFTVEADLSLEMARLRDENARICNESAELKQQQKRLEMEQEAVKRKKEHLDILSEALHQKLKEVEETRKTAMAAREYGEKCLNDAQKHHTEIANQTHILHLQTIELQRREEELSKERIALVRMGREAQLVHYVRNVDIGNDVSVCAKNSSHDQSSSCLPISLSMFQSIATEDTFHLCSYKSMQQSLDQLKSSRCARQVKRQAIEDRDELEQQEEFLYSPSPLLCDS